MKHPFRLENPSASLKALQTHRLIADIKRVVEILNSDISEEEALARVSDRSKPEYPILARVLAARRDNLQSTMAALEQRINDLSPAMRYSPEPAGANRQLFDMV